MCGLSTPSDGIEKLALPANFVRVSAVYWAIAPVK